MKDENIKVFLDTINYIENNEFLSDAVNKSRRNTKIYKEKINLNFCINKSGIVNVTKNRSFDAAMRLQKHYPDKKIGVLNFASATNPGGGVTKGSSAQEESLCRISTLYNVLNSKYLLEHFYTPNRLKNNPLHDDTVIYTPDIVICKSDNASPTRLKKEEFIKVDVLTCAAPNLREKPANSYNLGEGNAVKVSDQELYEIHLKRARQILNVALVNNIDILVLGAFGCGAFKNNPYVVAKAYKDILKEYRNYFDLIEFAIFINEYNKENYLAFKIVAE